ncbi:MAG: exodeoxyribonuclease III [Candidatus Pacebacteria bacterium]|jgi:exodeoxyribonuclease-3|nr:exodeoxyribonuclease III [Candidatus Paceibacterota bacterium]|tara:strand:- start:37404 stop:38171 length:768 start_codon:yes stop_codon:yes gene_type:complete
MKILSWNVNGLRAIHKKDSWNDFFTQNADIFCIQETKAQPQQLPEQLREIRGHFSFFASAEIKKGYSGVAVYTKTKPKKVEYGMGIKRFDQEGRLLTLYFKNFILLNVYFPNGGMGPERLKYKLDFYDAFLNYIEKLKKGEKKIIFCGDINTAHEEIDLARPRENKESTGFLPEERAWIDEVIRHGYIDTFRHLNPDKKDSYSYWDIKTRARDRNIGWRLDYFFISSNLQNNLKKAFILSDIFGSDHAPVGIELS